MKWPWRRISLARALPRPRYPHRPQVLDIVQQHADPLHRRIRQRYLLEFVDRVLAHEPDAESFVALSQGRGLAALVVHALQVCDDITEEDREIHQRFEFFSEEFYQLRNEDAKLRRIREYIEQTEPDAKKRRGDMAATEEFLNYDVLIERHSRAREERAAAIELALGFIGGAIRALTDPDADGAESLAGLLLAAEVDVRLARYIDSGSRWQNRLAALRALVTFYVDLDKLGLFKSVDSDVYRVVVGLADNERENPWLQIAASRILLVLPRDERYGRLYRRLVHDSGTRPATDFLVRRSLVESSQEFLGVAEAERLLGEVVKCDDPSDHVRMGIAHAFARMGFKSTTKKIEVLLAREVANRRSSPRVRATCAIAVTTALDHAEPDKLLRVAKAGSAVFIELIEQDKDRLVLEIAAEEAVKFCAALNDTDGSVLSAGLVDRLLERRSDPSLHAGVHEALSAAAEKIEALTSEARAQWTDYLGRIALTIRPGESKTLALDRRPDGLPPLPEDPAWLGRILADLSRRDWGLSVTRQGDKLKIWRGDHFGRRMWRILYEVTHPTPNKRQAFVHTIGRRQRGRLRAHPGSMDEVTATTVPGERVVIDTEGSWGRHLPLVDDFLDLPVLSGEPVTLFSSHGAVRIAPPKRLLERLRNRIKISLEYRKLVLMRVASLRAGEPQERRRYLEAMNKSYGIACSYAPYEYEHGGAPSPSPSPYVTTLMPRRPQTTPTPTPTAAATTTTTPTTTTTAMTALATAVMPQWQDLRHWLDEKLPYFLDPRGNSQTALAIFAGALAGLMFFESYNKRSSITKARDSIPLSIGGWGTRGKSGTERIKAGLFHGLGYHTFTKTTGCEAMFINSLPGQTSLEVFIYRPYNKATIWEQKAMIELASKVGAEVFLWECMALNPAYVQLLQHVWMRDDLVTLTNAFPDHEDIQGPAGQNVAQVISSFIPPKKTLFTTETNFLPLFRDRCDELGGELITVPPRDGDLIAQDVLDLFPYQEHPRNIALVARMAEYLGIEWTFSMVMMAEHVVPDLGVLKTYPTIRLRGRTLAFVNGMSANERAGCLNNWRRMECDKLDLETEPEHCVITVVNNRDDRISRSEVFARIIVEDLVVDKHVLIGTNLRGLIGYIENSLDNFVPTLEVLGSDAESSSSPEQRLAAHMARLRIPRPAVHTLVKRLQTFASGGNLVVAPESLPKIEERLRALLEPSRDATVAVDEVREALEKDKGLVELVKLALVEPTSSEPGDGQESGLPASTLTPTPTPVSASASGPTLVRDSRDVPEIIEPATIEDIREHFFFLLARVMVHARLIARARAAAENNKAQAFHEVFWDTYKALHRELVVVVESSGATGDQVIDRAIRSAAPGSNIILLGIQNIKGTGLDFVYRWVALDKVVSLLSALSSEDQSKRENCLRELSSFGDHGMVDSGLARILLARMPREHLSAQEQQQFSRVQERTDRVFKERIAKLEHVGSSSTVDNLFNWLEEWFDNLDSIRRFRQSNRVNRSIVEHRISLAQAAIEMREIYARQKGGWLAKLIKSSKK